MEQAQKAAEKPDSDEEFWVSFGIEGYHEFVSHVSRRAKMPDAAFVVEYVQ